MYRIYTAVVLYVLGDEILVDALAELPADQQEQLRHSEHKPVEYLASRALGEEQAWR